MSRRGQVVRSNVIANAVASPVTAAGVAIPAARIAGTQTIPDSPDVFLRPDTVPATTFDSWGVSEGMTGVLTEGVDGYISVAADCTLLVTLNVDFVSTPTGRRIVGGEPVGSVQGLVEYYSPPLGSSGSIGLGPAGTVMANYIHDYDYYGTASAAVPFDAGGTGWLRVMLGQSTNTTPQNAYWTLSLIKLEPLVFVTES